jgi:hypothetical protein
VTLWDRVTRGICFVLGLILVITGFTWDPVRVSEVIVGLILMGVFSVDQVRRWVRGGNGNGDHAAPAAPVTPATSPPVRPVEDAEGL